MADRHGNKSLQGQAEKLEAQIRHAAGRRAGASSSRTEDHSDVLEAVQNLPVKYKDVIWLYYYEGYQTEEIARILGSPPSTIRNRMRDARRLLKDKLGGEYG